MEVDLQSDTANGTGDGTGWVLPDDLEPPGPGGPWVADALGRDQAQRLGFLARVLRLVSGISPIFLPWFLLGSSVVPGRGRHPLLVGGETPS